MIRLEIHVEIPMIYDEIPRVLQLALCMPCIPCMQRSKPYVPCIFEVNLWYIQCYI